MRIQTQGYSNKVWLSSDEGVINGTMILSAPTLEKILQAVNEKYGTSFEGWSQLPTAYEVGDTVTNWNAYEKIERQPQKISIDMGQNVWIIGDFIDGVYRNWTNPGESTGISVHEDGIVFGNQGLPEYVGVGMFNQFLSKIGLEATSVENYYISMEIGSLVPGWENYTKIPK